MAAGVPPPPLNSPAGSYYWLEWYTNLTNFLNGTNIPWANLNFSGSNIADIQTRDHNSLEAIQGGNASGTASPSGNAFHMLGAEYIGFVSAGGVAVKLPAGWSCSGTNPYTVTHSLGLPVTSYAVAAVSNLGAATVNTIVNGTTNFVVTLSAAAPFSFIMTQGS